VVTEIIIWSGMILIPYSFVITRVIAAAYFMSKLDYHKQLTKLIMEGEMDG